MLCILRNYGLEKYHKDPAKILEVTFILDKLIQDKASSLHAHLKRIGVDPIMYAQDWFMTVFTSTLHFNLVVRIIDAMLSEGMKILYRAALAILIRSQPALMAARNNEAAIGLIKRYKETDDDGFMETAFKINLSRKELQKYEAEYAASLRK
eukprot:TRINITY_DN4176_c0_g1_i3.p1 TRINITY_DN4176_c0_g1~~TRINITY_DN4176_c0_g1_i3.p1  ORF type:complete len:152 (-),score=34.63 TRINITY_DN4176_c0_g1_i3:144-599(-)